MKRKRRYLIYFLIVIVLIASLIAIPLSKPVMNQKDIIIVIDAGHGGFDGGAVSPNGVKEDGLNLSVAMKLKTMCLNQGYGVIMTREDENAIGDTKDEDMRKRKQIIENSNASVVISIHMNKFSDTTCHGPVVFYHKDSEEGEKLAKIMQEKLVETLKPERPRVEKPETYFILRSGDCPCVLVECGFLSNAHDEELLQTKDYQEKCATAIFKGLQLYFSQRYMSTPA